MAPNAPVIPIDYGRQEDEENQAPQPLEPLQIDEAVEAAEYLQLMSPDSGQPLEDRQVVERLVAGPFFMVFQIMMSFIPEISKSIFGSIVLTRVLIASISLSVRFKKFMEIVRDSREISLPWIVHEVSQVVHRMHLSQPLDDLIRDVLQAATPFVAGGYHGLDEDRWSCKFVQKPD